MKSFLFISALILAVNISAAETGRFQIDGEKMLVTFFGEAGKGDAASSYEGVEKRAWGDAVQYLYKNYGLLAEIIGFSNEGDAPVVPELVRRLRSRNTIYHTDGVVRVEVEFSYEGYELKKKDPFASFKQNSDKM